MAATPSAAAGKTAVAAAPSHAEFLLEQTKQNVRQLEATRTLDPILCRQLNMLLAQAVVAPPPEPPARPAPVARSASKELDSRNKWAREVLSDTSFLPTLVDTALQAAAGPLLGSSQREAIVQIVSISQDRIAKALTNPEYQRNTQRFTVESKKATQAGISKGWRNVNDQWARKKEQNMLKGELRRSEKQEVKAMQEELRREREDIARGGTATATPPPPPPLPPTPRESTPAPSYDAPDVSQLVIGDADPGAASVTSLPTQHVHESGDVLAQGGAVCTTYSPWPGLVLTSTIVASGYDQAMEGDEDSFTDGRRLPPRLGTVPLPPRPAPPPPVPAPPVHHSTIQTDYTPPPPPSRAPPPPGPVLSSSGAYPVPSALQAAHGTHLGPQYSSYM